MRICAFIFLLALVNCNPNKTITKLTTLQGETLGSVYSVQYVPVDDNDDLKTSIDSLLNVINQSISTEDNESLISKLNSSELSFDVDEHLIFNYVKAQEIYKRTDGYFNPAIMPLVDYWGNLKITDESEIELDSIEVNEILNICNFNLFNLRGNTIKKGSPKAELDFSALAKGYTVDKVSELLRANRVENFMINIGGEVFAEGTKSDGSSWVVEIENPYDENSFLGRIELNGKSIATSGSYENFKILHGKRLIAYTINPKTGYSQQFNTDLLSTSVIYDDCATADGFATAFKAMGLKHSMEYVIQHNSPEVLFVYMNKDGQLKTWTNSESFILPKNEDIEKQ